jgi:cytochrome c-type biogenesis protein CcmE
MARKSSPARLVIALSVAGVLAIFLFYTSIQGGTPSVAPSQLGGRTEQVTLTGKVVTGSISGNAEANGLHFHLRDIDGGATTRVPVVYTGSVPPQFKNDRHVLVTGKLVSGTFVADKGSMITKCPSKYTAVEPQTSSS